MTLPLVPPLELISERLPIIFPEGSEHRQYCIREMSAKTIYTMFYVGAIEGLDQWIRPSQVTDMTDEQASALEEGERITWAKLTLSNKKPRPAVTWYRSNSREPIRDETIKLGLIPCQAIIERKGLPTTSSKPIYALHKRFAELFDPLINGNAWHELVEKWQKDHLSKAAMTRLHLMKHVGSAADYEIEVSFPNGSKRKLSAGPSSVISKAIIEDFAPRFLKQPTVLWLSESGNKVVAQDDNLAKSLRLVIDPKKALPDIILVDLGSKIDGSDMVVLFIEVVATDGPINRARKVALNNIAIEAGFDANQLAFLSAYNDRSVGPFRKNVADLAWGSYVWFVTEPEHIMALSDGNASELIIRSI